MIADIAVIGKAGGLDMHRRSAGSSACATRLGIGFGIWVWDWVALGWPKRRPRATQGWRKGRMAEVLLFAVKDGKGRVG